MNSGLRQAAIALRALHADDRKWMLGTLSSEDRATLEALMGEARELGIPSDAAFVTDMLGRRASHHGLDAQELERLLDDCTSDNVRLVLANEPYQTIAILLASRSWSWSGDVLRGLGSVKQQQIAQKCRVAPPRELYAVVLRETCARLPACEQGRQRGWREWPRRIAGLLRRGGPRVSAHG